MVSRPEIASVHRASEDECSNPLLAPTIGDVILARFSRREVLRGVTAVAALASLAPLGTAVFARNVWAGDAPALDFEEVPHGNTETHAVPEGYRAQTLMRWGDPVEAGAPAFDPLKQTAAAQAKQWGYNNDFVGWMPLPAGSGIAGRGLLCVNFEYTDTHLMFPGLQPGDLDKVSKEQVDTELAAHGHAVIEIRRDEATGAWSVVEDSPYNRRITALATECRISGPAAGDARLRTTGDPTGTKVVGTLNNCAGGKTPWGAVLIAEENFQQYFAGDPEKTSEARNLKRYGFKPTSEYAWSRYYDRFDVEKDPREPNKFGWMVEFDPYDPKSVPVKRTALGRFRHEGATTVVNKDGRVVAYSGDDERFDYLYRFVTDGRFDPKNRDANHDLLDKGTLYVARFADDGRLTWMPLIWGQGPLTAENGFASQADVLIETRRAGDLLGATPMDRPEDVETNPATGIVYVVLTYNDKRKPDQASALHPRAPNPHGQIVELIPPGSSGAERDHAASEYRWDIFLMAGDPRKPEDGARYHPQVTDNGWLSAPDNIAFDRKGRIWIATDGMPRFGVADGAYVAETEGPRRALTRQFYRTPIGAELCGPELNTDDTAYFAAVQHPGDTKGSTFDNPSTRWPDFQPGMPPRPSIQVIVKKGGGIVGS
jgi:secreted PhoX family phosphatase